MNSASGIGGMAAQATRRAPGPPGEAAQIESELRDINGLLDGIDQSVAYARNQLWGPTPEKDSGRAGPIAVEPTGILPGTLHRVRAIRQRLQALAESAGNLRNI